MRRPPGLRLPWPARGGGCPAEKAVSPRAVYRPMREAARKSPGLTDRGEQLCSDCEGDCNIQHRRRYTELAPDRFKGLCVD